MKNAFSKSRTPGRPDPVSVHVGARLRTLRTLAGCSQQALGTAIGVSFQQVQKYERGLNRLSVDMLWRAAQHFAEPIDWFFAHMPEVAGPPPPGTSSALSDGEAALLTAWRRLSPRQQATIADLTASMAHVTPSAVSRAVVDQDLRALASMAKALFPDTVHAAPLRDGEVRP